jgi:hypothetical protein
MEEATWKTKCGLEVRTVLKSSSKKYGSPYIRVDGIYLTQDRDQVWLLLTLSKLSDSVKGGEFLDHLIKYKILEQDHSPRSCCYYYYYYHHHHHLHYVFFTLQREQRTLYGTVHVCRILLRN